MLEQTEILAGSTTNGVNGQGPTIGANGHAASGHSASGHSASGHSASGHSASGHSASATPSTGRAHPNLSTSTLPDIYRLAEVIRSSAGALIELAKEGIQLSSCPDANLHAVSALRFIRNVFSTAQDLNDVRDNPTADSGIRSYYRRIVAEGMKVAHLKFADQGEIHLAIKKFLSAYQVAQSPTADRESGHSVSQFEGAMRDFSTVLKRLDVEYGTAHRHEKLRWLLRDEIAALRGRATQSHELWKVRCYDNPLIFARKFPSGDDQRQAIEQLQEVANDSVWREALK